MEKVELFCDFCGTDITTFVVSDYGKEFQINSVYTTNRVDTKKIFTHLCKRCASKLDYLFERLDKQESERIELVKRRYEINEKRKRIFNTNG